MRRRSKPRSQLGAQRFDLRAWYDASGDDSAARLENLVSQPDSPCVFEQQNGPRAIDGQISSRDLDIFFGEHIKHVTRDWAIWRGFLWCEVAQLLRGERPLRILLEKEEINNSHDTLVA